MKRFRLALLALLLIVPFAAASHAQVAIGVGDGAGGGSGCPCAYGPPVCGWGYYPYYPYDCAPYGYYGPSWFVSGVFIGAGPWYAGAGAMDMVTMATAIMVITMETATTAVTAMGAVRSHRIWIPRRLRRHPSGWTAAVEIATAAGMRFSPAPVA